MQEVDVAICIMRAQPFHNGHQVLVDKAMTLARKKVIVLVGSATGPRTIKNPFTFEERKQMITSSVQMQKAVLSVRPLNDYLYNDQQWVIEVQKTIANELSTIGWSDYPPKIAIVGFDKDHSTRYLKWFPQWDYIEASSEGTINIDATKIRNILFNDADRNINFVSGVVPAGTRRFIADNVGKQWWSDLCDEYDFIKKYKSAWTNSPYPPTFVTADAIVIQDGHVLLVERGACPGKGLMALPGGFVNQNERIEDAAIRELREETRLKVPEAVLRGSIVSSNVFDAPDRSLRGRTITHAFLFKLASGPLPKVKGSDDAKSAMWVPLNEVKREMMFEDHADLLSWSIGKV